MQNMGKTQSNQTTVNNEDYIVYYENVVNGIEDFLTHVVDWQLVELNVKTAEHYVDFNEVCKSIKNNFGFRSLEELHEFFCMDTTQAGAS